MNKIAKSFLGIDTSNYTTSAALLTNNAIINNRMLLSVKEGELGLRQSEAVFSHVKQIDEVLAPILSEHKDIGAVGVSSRPRNQKDSYMPCFLVGEKIAEILSAMLEVPIYKFSHQEGHVAAALFSIDKLELLKEKFVAFHVSGGTTEALYCEPTEVGTPSIQIIAKTLDLNAGQVIDRAGVMLGLSFPCGKELEKLAEKSNKEFEYKVPIKDGNVSFSGIENKFKDMYEKEESKEDIAKFTITAIRDSLDAMCSKLLCKNDNLPVIFAGGVSSNKMIRSHLESKYRACFAMPDFSTDNAVGPAVLARVMTYGV